MAEFLTVVVVAFVAQLAVLPGEKGQFIIAGLSTHYRPAVVVSAASLAFGGWTAVEIWFGRAVQGTLSPVVLDALTAGLFLLFAVMLVRSAPDDEPPPSNAGGFLPDGGDGDPEPARPAGLPDPPSVLGHQLSGRAGSFASIFALMAAGEFGDKTQLVTIALAIRFGAHPGIWVGEMLAIVPVSLANAYLFHHYAGRVDARRSHLAGAALFAFFGIDTAQALVTGVSVWEVAVSTLADVVASAA